MLGLCYTCLSQDREVKTLDSVRIKSILWEWFQKGNINVNVDEFKLCWECIACFLKIYKFKHQVFVSQEVRLKLGRKKSPHLINLSRLSTHTKHTYDTIYEHDESSNSLDSSDVSKVSKKRAIEKSGKDNLSITFTNKNGKISLKNSRNSNYNSAKNKVKAVDLNDNEPEEEITEVDLTNETDSNDSNKDSTITDKGTLDLLSILTGSEHPEEAKLLSQPYVLIQREEHMKESSKHSKIKRRKRKHSKTSGVLDIEGGATNVGANAGANENRISNHSKRKHRKRKHNVAGIELEENDATNVGTNAASNEDGIPNHPKHKQRKRKHKAASDEVVGNGVKNTETDAPNVGANADANEGSISKNSKQKRKKRKHNTAGDDLGEKGADNIETVATNVGIKAGANKDDSSNHSKRKQRKRKRNIIHDDSEENEAQNSETYNINVGTKVGANKDDTSNQSKRKQRKRKRTIIDDDLEENTEIDVTNVGTNADENEDSDSNHPKQEHRNIILNTASGEFEEDEDVNIETDATNDDPEPSPNVNNTEELSPDLPEVKFTIVHLSEEQMLKTRDIDRNDRLYLNRAYKCQTCIIGFLDISQCEKHHNEKHSELTGTFVCPICDTRFKKEAFLKLHENTHYRSYSCLHCPFAHHRRYVIETHVVKEHELKPSPVCPDCDMEFDTQQLLVSHYEIAHKERLKCNICAETFNTYAGVRKHAAIHKRVVDNGIIAEIYHCARCNCNFEGKPFYRTHMQYAHKNLAQNAYCADCDIYKIHKGVVDNEIIAEIYHCARCNCNFEGKAFYRTHMQYAHKNLAQNAYCADCDIQFSGIHKYTQHLEESDKHHRLGDTKFDCVHCSFKSLTKEALLAHIVRSHRLLSQTCALCNKGFSDPPRLKNHIQAKHPEVIAVKPVKDKICPICSNGFSSRSDLLDHMRSHKAEKPYQCAKCHKRFIVNTLLKKHVQRTHPVEDN